VTAFKCLSQYSNVGFRRLNVS